MNKLLSHGKAKWPSWGDRYTLNSAEYVFIFCMAQVFATVLRVRILFRLIRKEKKGSRHVGWNVIYMIEGGGGWKFGVHCNVSILR